MAVHWGFGGSIDAERGGPVHSWLSALCLGQMSSLREEKEQSLNQVQELETSLAELRSQIGKQGRCGLGVGI